MRLIVIGNRGQVVTSLVRRVCKEVEIVQIGRPDVDLENPRNFIEIFSEVNPDIIVNPAAYTSVDRAESEPETVFAINTYGAGAVAAAAAEINVPCIYLSTDYVFDGLATVPINENSITRPLNIYGKSKLAGEEMVISYTANHVILRTAWIYSPFGSNFLCTMLNLAKTQSRFDVVADQFGSPTSALQIADSIFKIAHNLINNPEDNALRGVFHMTAAGGPVSWADFAEEIFLLSAEYGGPIAKIRRIATEDYPQSSCRPAYSCLDCSKLAEFHGIRLSHWKDGLRKVFPLFNFRGGF